MVRGILPKHLLDDKQGKEFNSADFNTKSPVGTGPYKFKEWVKDSYILLEANKEYFKGAPKIDSFEASCFDGVYITGDVSAADFAAIETQRSSQPEDEEGAERSRLALQSATEGN